VDSALSAIRKNIDASFFPQKRNPKRISNLPHLRSSSFFNHLSQHTEQKLRIALLQMQPPYYTPDGGMKTTFEVFSFGYSLARSATSNVSIIRSNLG